MSLREKTDSIIRVLLVDDHPITRQGIRALVEMQSDLRVCGEADGEEAAIRLMAEVSPHVAVVDISLGGSDGLQLVRKLKATSPHAAILVLSMHEESVFADRAKAAGAAAYVMKQHASNVIITAIRQAAARNGEKAPAAGSRALLKRRLDGGGVDQLSAREREVLIAIGDGFSTREIAEKLSLSTKTIDTHREHLKRKLNVQTGEDLVRFAIQWANGEARSIRMRQQSG